MKTTFTFLALLAFGFTAYADDPTVSSPNKRYILTLRHLESEPIWPVIFLRDVRTGRENQLFNYDSVGQGTYSLDATWSPNSRYVALTIIGGPSTTSVEVYRISKGNASEVELLPLPKRLDKKKYSFRGGEFAEYWQDNRTLWIGDSSKDRRFCYRLIKDGKLLAIGFEDNPPPQ